MKSRPFWELDEVERDLVLGICLDDDDLRDLGAPASPPGLDREVSLLGRWKVHRSLRPASSLARRAGDRLDLRHAEVVLWARAEANARVAGVVADVLSRGTGDGLPALVWALVTDERRQIQALGVMLARMGSLLACGAVAREWEKTAAERD